MKQKYTRTTFEVEAEKYEIGKGMEDGYEAWTKVITNGWVSAQGVVQITREEGSVVCPFIRNRRGIIFLHEGDYIIYDVGGERHCCGEDKFNKRYRPI